ncbi:hypothetical protein TREMEDRAFT_35639 [Tremella mesenterica DSM 1558]|uniref:uncharacterized protein n=1 Tax=Tremella mesenterica (strain ATCC 24925 / CBS 8224 / DSM 1558 / NBRC 9311 / NRRL Y-6157 / RJB 2259-6 / UBC 559-6) TaxID=578456 RepID=UPI00032BC527|nr:uncharacterized protein TREMEDRAFT_35639 [Tremella mesenterica DSM 1558]EIW65906.1 hypothetical protein TREMEDRAFT_35639 [Tremella mesenterica DSM 1558]
MSAKDVKKQTAKYDLYHRIHSIATDCEFVNRVREGWYGGRFEIIPNQRCGNWYCDPSSSSNIHAYFKSTDGHNNNWQFNLRRSNLSLAEYAERRGGIILVDSTRRGKRMPDALSKTVPIWCAVINLVVKLRHLRSKWSTWNTSLYTPPNIVSSSEKSQIEVLIPEWAEKLLDSSLIIPQLKRPLRPFFLHPATSSPPQIPDDPEWTSIICLSASRWVGGEDDIPASTKVGKRTKGFEYVQGAGDDDELWAKGLTPAIFYKHKQVLLSADQDDLEKLVFELVKNESHQAAPSITHSGPEIPFDRLTISDPLVGIPTSNSLLALDIGPAVSSFSWQYHHREAITIYPLTNTDFSGNVPHLDDHRGKRGRRFVLLLPSPRSSGKAFSQSLIKARNFISSLIEDGQPVILRPGRVEHWDRARTSSNRMDEMGGYTMDDVMPTVEDRRRIIPLALLALCSIPHLSQFSPSQPQNEVLVDKSYIADMLYHLVSLWPDGNPPRAALKRVNEILMS